MFENSARDVELMLLNRCVTASKDDSLCAKNSLEANLFQVANMLISSKFPIAAKNLQSASELYFKKKPQDRLSAELIVENCLIGNIPRFKDGLIRELTKEKVGNDAKTL